MRPDPLTGGAMDDKAHYLGHRQRLRDRFLGDLGTGFSDYELVELLLFLALPRTDVKPLAKALIAKRKGEKMLASGSISLQAESHPCEFRKIMLKPLEVK